MSFNTKNMLIASMSIVSISACSSGDSPTKFDTLADETSALSTQISRLEIVDSSMLPVSGAVTYGGTVGFALNQQNNLSPRIIGDIAITADFQSGDENITGDITNFTDANDQSYSGALSLENGLIVRNASTNGDDTFEADIVGTVTNDATGATLTTASDNLNEPYIAGGFYGDVADAAPSHLSGDFIGAFEDDDGNLVGINGGLIVARR